MSKLLADIAIERRGNTFDNLWNPIKGEPSLGISDFWQVSVEKSKDGSHIFFLSLPFKDGSSIHWKIDSMTFNGVWKKI